MTQRLCKQCNGWHHVDAWPRSCVTNATTARAAFPTPMFTSDSMDPMQSMATGMWHDSKSALAAEYKREGVRVTTHAEMTAPREQENSRPAVIRAAKQAGLI